MKLYCFIVLRIYMIDGCLGVLVRTEYYVLAVQWPLALNDHGTNP